MSINLRLLLLIGTGLLTAVIMSLVSYLGNSKMAAAVNDNEVSMTALRNHLEADMMHDALRVTRGCAVGAGGEIVAVDGPVSPLKINTNL